MDMSELWFPARQRNQCEYKYLKIWTANAVSIIKTAPQGIREQYNLACGHRISLCSCYIAYKALMVETRILIEMPRQPQGKYYC